MTQPQLEPVNLVDTFQSNPDKYDGPLDSRLLMDFHPSQANGAVEKLVSAASTHGFDSQHFIQQVTKTPIPADLVKAGDYPDYLLNAVAWLDSAYELAESSGNQKALSDISSAREYLNNYIDAVYGLNPN